MKNDSMNPFYRQTMRDLRILVRQLGAYKKAIPLEVNQYILALADEFERSERMARVKEKTMTDREFYEKFFEFAADRIIVKTIEEREAISEAKSKAMSETVEPKKRR